MSVVITEPAPDAMIDSDRVNVRGTFSGPAGTGIVVNDTIALARGGRFALNELPLTAGSNTISVVATAIDGRTATTSISVTSSGSPPRLRLTADTTSGTAPLSVTFGYDRSETTTVTKIAIDFDGNGTDDFTSKKTPPTQVQNTYTVPGLYQARLRLADSSGTTLESYSSILVESQSERDDLFTSLWSGMNDALLKRDVSTALSYLNSRARPRYATVFQDLLPDMPAIIATYSVPHFVSSYFGVLEYAVNRLVDDEDQIYFIYLMRDADGVWRFEAM